MTQVCSICRRGRDGTFCIKKRLNMSFWVTQMSFQGFILLLEVVFKSRIRREAIHIQRRKKKRIHIAVMLFRKVMFKVTPHNQSSTTAERQRAKILYDQTAWNCFSSVTYIYLLTGTWTGMFVWSGYQTWLRLDERRTGEVESSWAHTMQ